MIIDRMEGQGSHHRIPRLPGTRSNYRSPVKYGPSIEERGETMNSQNRENHQINQRKGFHPLGSDRMLVASVGSTPGSGATFVGNQGRRHRRRSTNSTRCR